MRTNIDIDDTLMARAMQATGARTKKQAVEEALKLAIRLDEQRKALEAMRGLGWEGDLDAMREGREFPPLP
ncbi:MAG: type II toxin-antitoxin system VapB family antitoxin [Acetobacteraceae bacterium]|nr:type II toxin-antitoxin system VapB family antitoxin [Acetobacteraceae bacterium]